MDPNTLIDQYGLMGGAVVALSSMGVAIASMVLPKKTAPEPEEPAHTCMTNLAPYVAESLKVNTQLLALLEQNQTTMQTMLELVQDNSALTKESLLLLKYLSEDVRRKV